MRSFLAALMVIGIGWSAQANDFGLTAGFRSNNVDTNVAGKQMTGETGMQFGGLAWLELSDVFYLRSGFLYTQKYFSSTQSGTATKFEFSYLDIPITGMYRFSDYGGVFFGPVLSFNQSKSTNNNLVPSGVKSNLIPLQMGVSFKFAPQLGGELVYEFVSGEISDDFDNLRSLGANFVVWFE